jgi:fumarylacetoacetase
LASGTVSGPAHDQLGCLLELTSNGAKPMLLADGSRRAFLEDGDEVVIDATTPGPGGELINFGAVRGRSRTRP